MPEPLKNLYNTTFFNACTSACEQCIPNYDRQVFLNDVHDEEWENRELKQRIRHVTLSLKKQLPEYFPDSLKLLLKLVPKLNQCQLNAEALGLLFLPDFIELFGLEYPHLSLAAFEQITPLITCEFAIRPYIINDQEMVLAKMLEWSQHENLHVRRLATEGCRPRLPWAMALPAFKTDPTPILPIIEILKNDETEYVRRSVANNLNDISKDHPELVIDIAQKWIGKSPNTDRIVKHACRTLLKQGNQVVMALFGFGDTAHVTISELTIHTPKVVIKNYLEFSFLLTNSDSEPSRIRLEYAIYYLKANGSSFKKVFKISEKEYAPYASLLVTKKHSFKLITTRRFYPGSHQLSIIVNGKELVHKKFELLATK